MCGVIEIDKGRKIVDTRPCNTAAQIPALSDRPQFHTGRMNRRQSCRAILAFGAVTIDTRRSWGHCRMSCIKNRVVAVTTVQLQLPCVNRVAKGDWLGRLIADIQGHGVSNQSTHGTSKDNARSRCYRKNTEEWVDPTRKQEPLHDLIGRRSTRSPVPH